VIGRLVGPLRRAAFTRRHDQPKSLLEIGGCTVLEHVLEALQSGGIRKTVVQIGHQGVRMREVIRRVVAMSSPQMIVEIHDLGEGWRAGHAMSVTQAEELVKKCGGSTFLLCPADHVYDPELISAMIAAPLAPGDTARMLVETDLAGMVGLSPRTVHVALRPLHSADRIYQIGTDLSVYSAIDAGLCLFSHTVFEKLAESHIRMPYVTLANVQQGAAAYGSVTMLSTKGRTWFSVETEGALDYTREGLTKLGHQTKLNDGRVVQLIGLPKKVQTSPSSGGDWAEFSVARWRSAVFTTKSFFSQLYDDTSTFIGNLAEKLGGTEKVLLVEVGCGTGEALQPLVKHCKYQIGMDFNDTFINFCTTNLPAEQTHKVKFLLGDATDLGGLLSRDAPAGWLDGTTKITFCVGNTIGIMPPEVQEKVYQQMADVAGRDGVAVMVYWNGNCFGEAVQHFYFKNPQLCGPFDGSCVDLATCTLQTPSGYNTHWTTPEEAEANLVAKGLEKVDVVESGKGVLVAFRNKAKAA